MPAVNYGFGPLTSELASIGTSGPGLTGAASVVYGYRNGTRQVETVTFLNDALTRLTQSRSYDALQGPGI